MAQSNWKYVSYQRNTDVKPAKPEYFKITKLISKEEWQKIQDEKVKVQAELKLIKQEKANVVDRNVNAAETKTAVEKRHIFENSDETFLLAIDPVAYSFRVKNALSRDFRNKVGQKCGCFATLYDRCAKLGGEDIALLLDIAAQTDHARYHHPIQTLGGLFVSQYPHPGSALPVPFESLFTSIVDPLGVNFCDLANEPSIAQNRILVRGSIVDGLNLPISKGSIHLTFYLIKIFLSAAKDIAFNGAPDGSKATIAGFDDTRTRMIRVLVCQVLTICASGKEPACPAYTLFSDEQVPVHETEYWLMRDLVSVLPFTGWDPVVISKCVSRYRKLHH